MPEDEGLWRRDPEAFLRDRFARLIDSEMADPEVAAGAIGLMARAAGLPDPAGVVQAAARQWEQSGGWRRYFERLAAAGR